MTMAELPFESFFCQEIKLVKCEREKSEKLFSRDFTKIETQKYTIGEQTMINLKKTIVKKKIIELYE